MTGTRAGWSFNPLRINFGIGRGQYLRLGWELLRPGGHQAVGVGGFGRHGARGSGALQHAGGDQEVWEGVEKDCKQQRLGERLLGRRSFLLTRSNLNIHPIPKHERNNRQPPTIHYHFEPAGFDSRIV